MTIFVDEYDNECQSYISADVSHYRDRLTRLGRPADGFIR
jgi:hypothetical protein